MPVLEPDNLLRLPSVTVLKASAGSGKTFALTERYVQFLLSPRVPRNDLRNILAITFSNNASREMREKILEWLKLLHFRDGKRVAEMTALLPGFDAAAAADGVIGRILDRYSDFQAMTIDSFMAAVFRASALDFGFSPDFEIVMEPGPLIEYAFHTFLRDAREGSENADLLDGIVRDILSFKASADSYPWNPVAPLLAEVTSLDGQLSKLGVRPRVHDRGLREEEARARAALERVAALVAASGLEASARSTFPRLLASARAGRYGDLIDAGMALCPVKKPRGKEPAGQDRYDAVLAAWEEAGAAAAAYGAAWARSFHQPILRLHESLGATVEKVKRTKATVFIDDIGRALAGFLAADIVPDVYFRIGERVWHFLMDEFQDTSPLQWATLFPLVENSLAAGGSLFVVGDTKQAIYGFRKADYTIMRSLEAGSPFPSAEHALRELDVNRRSRPRVLQFVSEVFRTNAATSPQYAEAARRSGLHEWVQAPSPGDDPGYVEVQILPRDDANPPEREKVLGVISDLRARGYGWGDVAILALKNEQVVRTTAWLNEAGVPFISFSNLDVRTRPVASEVLALLAFLDSPPDDLSFATFLLGGIFGRALEARGRRREEIQDFLFRCRSDRPLYKAFQRDFPELWAELFAGLFRATGYLPPYDLLSEAFARFSVFENVEEEATLAKLLETVKAFEGTGSNSLRDFLGQAGSEGGEWAIAVPRSVQSVQAMTVHKAKGLGFPVVIVLLYGERRRGFDYTLLREPAAGDPGGAPGAGPDVSLVKITQKIAEKDPALQALYDEEVTREKVERLNVLYVALTRARRELYVVGVKRDGDTFPFDLLPVEGFAPSPEKGPAAPGARSPEQPAALAHEARPLPVSFARGTLGTEERRRGELAHRMLQLLEAGRSRTAGAAGDAEAALAAAGERAAREARLEASRAAGLVGPLLRVIRSAELQPLFAPRPDRTVLTEQEFCDREGRLLRMDRVVVDPGAVTVVDFKTGAEQPAEHEGQLRGYASVLSDAYPGRTVAALAAYIDLGVTRRIL